MNYHHRHSAAYKKDDVTFCCETWCVYHLDRWTVAMSKLKSHGGAD